MNLQIHTYDAAAALSPWLQQKCLGVEQVQLNHMAAKVPRKNMIKENILDF